MNIINLNDITSINKLYPNILSNKNIELNINFDDTECIKQVNVFLSENKNIKDYYLETDYNISIDLINYDYKIYLWLIDCIQIAYKKILNSNKYIILFENPAQWNISVCENIMFNFPFTLSNIIYLPISYIKLLYDKNNINKFVETLIHEKIHLGQRVKEKEWEKFIKNNSKNWIKISSNMEIFNLIEQFININQNINNYYFISNPDTFYRNFKYIYKDDNKYYYGQYMINNKTKHIIKKYFQIDINKKIFESSIILEEEHPYEIYAYEISNELT